MSYDLDFWKQPPGSVFDPQATYERLSSGESVEGLLNLPIEMIMQKIAETFHDWVRLDDATWESAKRGSFQVYTTPQFLRVDCYGMDGEDMNTLIDIAHDFGCPLYDPQVGTRFDAS